MYGSALGDANGLSVATIPSPTTAGMIDVAAGDDGYLIVWETDSDEDSDVRSAYMLAGEDTLGSLQEIAGGANQQGAPALACLPTLDCIVTFVDQEAQKAPSYTDVIRARFVNQTRLFASGFETGGLTQWSMAQP